MYRLAPAAALPLLMLSLAGCPASGTGPSPLTVNVVSPGDGASTRGVVSIAVETSDPAASVQILIDGAVVASGRTFAWDTTGASESTHLISAWAALAGEIATSGPVSLRVDRTAPTLVDRTPESAATDAWDGRITVAFDEPMNAASLGDAPPTVTTDGGQVLATTAALSEDGRTVEILLPSGPLYADTLAVSLPALEDRAGNAGAGVDWAFRVAPLTVAMTPAAGSSTFTNGVVVVEAEILGGDASIVTVDAGAARLGTFTAPPYRVAWDTRTQEEGWVELNVTAYRGTGRYAATASVVVDRTPPTIVGTTPQDGDLNVAWDAVTEVRLSEPVSWLSVAAGAASSGCGGSAPELAPDGSTIRFSHRSASECAQVVTVSGLTDYAGNVQASPLELRFTRPAWRWIGGPFKVWGANHMLASSLAVDGAGRPIVAWSEHDGSNPADVFASRWTGAGWEPLAPAGQFSAFVDRGGELAIAKILSGSGFFFAMGARETGGPRGVYAWVYSDWAGWTPLGGPLNVNPARDLNGFIDASEDANSNLWVGWKEFGQIDGQYSSGAYVQRFDWATKTWDPPHELHAPDARSPYDVRVAGGADGTVAAAWYEWTGPLGPTQHPEVFVEAYTAGVWIPLPPVTPGRVADCPDVAVADDGVIHASWVEGETGDRTVRAAIWEDATWKPLGAAINADPAANPACPRLAIDAEGRPLIAFNELEGEVRTLRARRWDGAAWIPVGSGLNPNPAEPAYGYDVAALAGRTALTAWNGLYGGFYVQVENR